MPSIQKHNLCAQVLKLNKNIKFLISKNKKVARYSLNKLVPGWISVYDLNIAEGTTQINAIYTYLKIERDFIDIHIQIIIGTHNSNI